MKKLLLVALLSLFQFAFSQNKGTVTGTLTDKSMNGEPLPFANVFIKGTSIGGTTDMDGKYTISVPSGNQTLVFSFVGYETIEKPITVVAGKSVVVNQEMGASEGVALEEVKITGTVSKEKESALLLEQKKATVIKESIGAQELSKKGVSDAATATTKVSGVSKQEGSNKVYVRGLGDRYNTTTMNGLPLPSNDPRNKNIALGLFSTDVIQNVGVSKSFDASLSGDVAGANIDIKTKEFSGKGNISVGVSVGGNSQTTFEKFNTIDGANWIGIANHTKHKVTNLNQLPFTDSFTPKHVNSAPVAASLSLSGGNRFNFKDDSSLSMFLVGAFSNSYRARKGLAINILNKKTDSNGNITGFTAGSDYPEALDYNYGNNKLAMGNFVYKINPNNKVSFNSLFIHSNSQKIQQYLGTKPDVADEENGELAYNILQTQNQNRLIVNQLLSEHKIGENYDLNIGLSYNIVDNDEPNRKKNIFKYLSNGELVTASGTRRNNSRYYHNLDENDINATFSVKKYFGKRFSDENNGDITLGYAFRKTNRDFKAYYFDYDLSKTEPVDKDNTDLLFNQQNLTNGVFRLQTGWGFGADALDPFTYNADKMVHSPYVVINYKLSDKFLINAGLRYDKINMDVEWNTNLTSSDRDNKGPQELNKNYFLPSLNLKYNITENNLIRLSVSKTYTYPQFKEIAPFTYEGATYIERGNKDLKPSEGYNLDLKWEMFPKRDELISATVFTKLINNSINRYEAAAASDNNYSWENTGDSKVYGVELEVKKNIFTFNEDNNEKLKLGFNAAYMLNEQDLIPVKSFLPTNKTSPLEGAAPLLINADITYGRKVDGKQTNASLIFNYQDEKLFSIGTNLLEGIYEKGVPKLDFIFKHDLTKKLGAKLSVKNILNPKIQRYRDLPTNPLTRSYKNGIDFSLGFSYKL